MRRKRKYRRKTKSTFSHQLLEERRLLACASIFTPPGQISIVGTDASERITVSVQANDTVRIQPNESDTSCNVVTMSTNGITKITIQGRGGNDTLRYTNNYEPGIKNYVYGQSGVNERSTIFGTVGYDNLSHLYGGDGNDVVNGGRKTDRIWGYGGNDTLRGGDSRDIIIGGSGNDTMYGGNGNDAIAGVAGNDTLYGEAGNDTLNAGDGDDLVHGGTGNDIVNAGFGADTVFGDAGNDRIYGETAATRNDPTGQADMLYGNDGDDLIWGGGGADYIQGDGDVLEYTSPSPFVPINQSLHQGNDRLYGGYGNDQLVGYRGNDVLFGQWGNDKLDGGLPAPALTGLLTTYSGQALEMGDDALYGGTGDDELRVFLAKGDHIVNGGEDPSGLDIDRLEYWYAAPTQFTPVGAYRAYTTSATHGPFPLPSNPYKLFDGAGIEQEWTCSTRACTQV